MSFDMLFNALSPLSDEGISELDKYSNRESSIISLLNPACENTILKDFNGQKFSVSETEFTIFQFYTDTLHIDTLTNFVSDKKSYYDPINFQITDNSMIINILSYNTLVDIIKSINGRYVFLTINYTSDAFTSAHRAILSLDKNTNNIYLLEPNGRPTFFSRILGVGSENFIEYFFDYYIGQLNEIFGTKFTYIHSNMWNKTHIVLNNSTNVSISDGDCLTISLMICQLINNLEMEPEKLYMIIKKLSDNEFVCLIRSYSIGIIKYLMNGPNSKYIKYIDNLYSIYSDMKDTYDFKSINDASNFLSEIKKLNPEFYNDLTQIYQIVTA